MRSIVVLTLEKITKKMLIDFILSHDVGYWNYASECGWVSEDLENGVIEGKDYGDGATAVYLSLHGPPETEYYTEKEWEAIKKYLGGEPSSLVGVAVSHTEGSKYLARVVVDELVDLKHGYIDDDEGVFEYMGF